MSAPSALGLSVSILHHLPCTPSIVDNHPKIKDKNKLPCCLKMSRRPRLIKKYGFSKVKNFTNQKL